MRRASSILKALSPDGSASASAASAARRKASASGARAGQRGLGVAGAPGLQGDAAERQPGLGDRAALEPQRGGGGDDGEGVGGALAHLEVAGMARRSRPPSAAGGRRRSARRARARSRAPACRRAGGGTASSGTSRRPAAAFDLDHGVERDQRHAEIGRVGGDAVLAPAEHGVQPVLAAARVAAGAGLALVAGAGGVVEIRRSACAAAGCRRRSRRCAAAPRRRTAALRPPRDSARAKAGSCARSALRTSAPMRTPPSGSVLDPVEAGQAGDVDQARRAARCRPSSGRAGWCRRPGRRRPGSAAAATASRDAWPGRTYSKRFMPLASRSSVGRWRRLRLQHRLGDAGIGAAAAEIAAHAPRARARGRRRPGPRGSGRPRS